MGPNTRGGFMVARVKFGFSFSTNSQAAFSANVLLAAATFSDLSSPSGEEVYLCIHSDCSPRLARVLRATNLSPSRCVLAISLYLG